MNYSEFLFCNLLREYSISFDRLPFDEMYENYLPLYKEYEESVFNVEDRGEYQCMYDFLEAKSDEELKF